VVRLRRALVDPDRHLQLGARADRGYDRIGNNQMLAADPDDR
jgi:hypothetical protein